MKDFRNNNKLINLIHATFKDQFTIVTQFNVVVYQTHRYACVEEFL